MNQPLTLQDVKETILKWAKSCERVEQVEGLEIFARQILITLFEKVETPLKLEIIREFLLAEMGEQKLIIKRKKLQNLNQKK